MCPVSLRPFKFHDIPLPLPNLLCENGVKQKGEANGGWALDLQKDFFLKTTIPLAFQTHS